MGIPRRAVRVLLCVLVLGLTLGSASAAEEEPAADGEWGTGEKSRGFKYTLNFQPVIPVSSTAPDHPLRVHLTVLEVESAVDSTPTRPRNPFHPDPAE